MTRSLSLQPDPAVQVLDPLREHLDPELRGVPVATSKNPAATATTCNRGGGVS
ncbi:hypothetical protein [Kribbella sp. NPDC051620]|uniref:hypothetical protein n=1 Tax=Kribbella sp. NPDC051620 TaxID=3364120 RepID=UPI00378900DC